MLVAILLILLGLAANMSQPKVWLDVPQDRLPSTLVARSRVSTRVVGRRVKRPASI